MKYERNIINAIKSRIDILDIVGERIELDRHNMALCPFHNDKRPSFSVNSKGQYFNCFGCGRGGDAIAFLMMIDNRAFPDVLQELAERAGVCLPEEGSNQRKELEKARSIEDVLSAAALYYHGQLTGEARLYLTEKRGLTDETIERFQIGYAAGGLWKHLLEELGYALDLCIEAGVIRKDDDSKIRDFFYRRIIFPHLHKGRVVHMSGRSIDDSDPKYLLLPGPIEHLYNEDSRGNAEVNLAEGIIDCLSAEQAGYPTVATLGTNNFKPEYAEKLSQCSTVYLCFDGDEAGRAATVKVGQVLVDRARVVELPDGQDLNDYLNTHSRADFEQLRSMAMPVIEDQVKAISRHEPEAPQIPDLGLSDSWNATIFVNTSGTKLHYVPANNSWLYWNGRYWEIDKILFVEKLALNFAQALWGKVGYIADSKDRDKWARHVKYTQSRRGIESLIKLARLVGSVSIALEEFDVDTRSLNTESGVIYFEPSTIDFHIKEHNPDILITNICPVIHDPEARSDLWEHFLRDATNNDKELELFIQRCAGYSLVGENPEEIFFFIWGADASGKSTFIEATKATMGDYAVSIDASAFLSQRSSGGPQPEVIKIKGKRIVIASETEPGKKFNTELIKSLSGRDTIGARDLYSKPIEFKFGGKLWVVSNFAPKVPVEDRAFMRRIIDIPFNNSLSEDKRDPDVKKILTDSDISGAAILNWLIEGYLNYLDIGLAIPDVVRESIKEYKDEINPITDFIAECCELDPGNKELQVASSELYEAYTEYCQKNNNKYSINKNRFGRCLRECGLEPARSSIKGTRVRSWVGIKLTGSSDSMDAF
jgi:DNA primase catalytic core